MNPDQQLINRRALDVLSKIEAGVSKANLYDQVERSIGRRLTVAERETSFSQLLEHEWIYDYPNPILGVTLLAITTKGRNEMYAL